MNHNISPGGARIIMRRLFKQDTDSIIECYKKYDALFYNPVNDSFVTDVLLQGQIWGAFFEGKIVACCCFFPLGCDFFKNTATYPLLCDFIAQPDKYMYMGYVGHNFDGFDSEKQSFLQQQLTCCNGLYNMFLNIAHMQAFRQGLRYVLHSMPVKMADSIEAMFSGGYSLIKMRGLDNLVVHYIFAKAVFPCEDIYLTDKDEKPMEVLLSDTKTISALLESGYCVIDILKGKDAAVLLRRLVTN